MAFVEETVLTRSAPVAPSFDSLKMEKQPPESGFFLCAQDHGIFIRFILLCFRYLETTHLRIRIFSYLENKVLIMKG